MWKSGSFAWSPVIAPPSRVGYSRDLAELTLRTADERVALRDMQHHSRI